LISKPESAGAKGLKATFVQKICQVLQLNHLAVIELIYVWDHRLLHYMDFRTYSKQAMGSYLTFP
jgi:hypothetical protein